MKVYRGEKERKVHKVMWYLYTIISLTGMQWCNWRAADIMYHWCWHYARTATKCYMSPLTIWLAECNGAINSTPGIKHWYQKSYNTSKQSPQYDKCNDAIDGTIICIYASTGTCKLLPYMHQKLICSTCICYMCLLVHVHVRQLSV